MLTAKEYAIRNHVGDTLPPEIAEFALFSVELDEAIDPTTRKVYHPNMRGDDTSLWGLRPVFQAAEHGQFGQDVAASEARKRAENLAKYVKQGFAFELPDGNSEEE
jgi:hypothetical protein